eukprot:Opistho-1_new@70654
MAQPSSRRQRTPEEIAKSIEIAKSVMQKQKKQDGLDSVKSGKYYVLIAASYYLIYAFFMYYYNVMEDFYLYVGLIGLYIIISIFFKRNPLVFSIIAFSIFMLIIAIQAIINPATLFGGLIFFTIKITALVGLVKAMQNSIKYKRELELEKNKGKSSDILDEGLIDFK